MPTAASESTKAAAEEKRSWYDDPANSTRKELIRIRANAPVYHSLVKTSKVKDTRSSNLFHARYHQHMYGIEV